MCTAQDSSSDAAGNSLVGMRSLCQGDSAGSGQEWARLSCGLNETTLAQSGHAGHAVEATMYKKHCAAILRTREAAGCLHEDNEAAVDQSGPLTAGAVCGPTGQDLSFNDVSLASGSGPRENGGTERVHWVSSWQLPGETAWKPTA